MLYNILEDTLRQLNLFYDSRSKINKKFPKWDLWTDSRINIFSRFITLLETLNISFVFVNYDLNFDERWVKRKIINTNTWKTASIETRKKYGEAYITFTKIWFIQWVYSVIESNFRIFVKTLDSSACKNWYADFNSLYRYLLTKINLKEYIELLDLLRLVRNTVHNNWVYFHKNNNDVTIKYNEISYDFIIWKKLDFVTWELISMIIKELNNLIFKVVLSKEISSLDFIKDSIPMTYKNTSWN